MTSAAPQTKLTEPATITEHEMRAVAHGSHVVRVRSNVVRDRTHHFYERLAYARKKTSHVFDKGLQRETPSVPDLD